jgi:AraC-like DNA-binding protein
VLYRLFRALLGPRWRALSVNFQHDPPQDERVHRRLFGPILQFNSEFNGFTCARADLDNVNPTADPILARHAERYLRSLPNTGEPAVAQEVRKAIYLLLPSAAASIRGVADSLGLNERTLQRRLTAEGAEFSQILNDVRADLAPRYVEMEGLTFARVAGLLGYSRQSSFNRWFAETFAMAPTAWRAKSRARLDAASGAADQSLNDIKK